MDVSLILLVIALVLLVLAAIGVSGGRVSLGWAGLAVWVLSIVLAGRL